MSNERKNAWKCHICKPRIKSPNTLYQVVAFDENSNNKQARTDDEGEKSENENTKKFKESVSLTSVKTKLNSVQSDVSELKTDLKDIKRTVEQLAECLELSNRQIKEEIKSSLSTITTSLVTLVDQVKELNEKDKQRETKINNMESRINKLEQQIINKNIEIKNVTNQEISPTEVIKRIATSVSIDIDEKDINRAYRLKNSNKIIVEFSTISKKSELMAKINRHRIDSKIINNNESNTNNATNSFIYVNDELTSNNRHLLWLTKTKAKEANWKFVWVRNGNIFARKLENAPLFIINNSVDIENMSNTI